MERICGTGRLRFEPGVKSEGAMADESGESTVENEVRLCSAVLQCSTLV